MSKFFNKKIAVATAPNIYDKLIVTTRQIDDIEVVYCQNDVAVLFNQDRLNKLSKIDLEKITTNLRVNHDDLKQFDDKTLQEAIVSRYIQSPCDVYNLQRYLENQEKELVENAKSKASYFKWKKEQASKKSDKSEEK